MVEIKNIKSVTNNMTLVPTKPPGAVEVRDNPDLNYASSSL